MGTKGGRRGGDSSYDTHVRPTTLARSPSPSTALRSENETLVRRGCGCLIQGDSIDRDNNYL